ncbi:MAG: hypothetical protein FJ035_09115 [Chloroflexi bacterium]|nr:hypothetical protein [Chloroflexota bacterium]
MDGGGQQAGQARWEAVVEDDLGFLDAAERGLLGRLPRKLRAGDGRGVAAHEIARVVERDLVAAVAW